MKRPAAVSGKVAKKKTATPAVPAVSVGAADAQALVGAHNALRGALGAPNLSWSPALATSAQAHANTLVGTCSLSHAASAHGENLAAWTGTALPLSNAVTLWGAEKPQYTGGGAAYQGTSDGAGHYTQVIWAATSQVGCGYATCSKNGSPWTLVVCRYDPRGNVIGQPVY